MKKDLEHGVTVCGRIGDLVHSVIGLQGGTYLQVYQGATCRVKAFFSTHSDTVIVEYEHAD